MFYASLDVDESFGDPFELESVPLALLHRPVDILFNVIYLLAGKGFQAVVLQVVQLFFQFLEFLLQSV